MSLNLDNRGLAHLAEKIKSLIGGGDGMGLSSNDFTDAYKEKLDSLENYVLPVASSTVLGGIKVGPGLSISLDGVLSNIWANGIPWANITGKPDNLATTDDLASKQNKLTGSAGQVVGFDSSGNAVPQSLPDSSGITESEADARYLQLSGGEMTGAIKLRTSTSGVPSVGIRSSTTDQGAFVRIGMSSNGSTVIGFAKADGNSAPVRLNGVATPVSDNDATPKSYVDGLISGGGSIQSLSSCSSPYASDFYLYINGTHPVLSANPFNDYFSFRFKAMDEEAFSYKFKEMNSEILADKFKNMDKTSLARNISLTGNSQTITVYDGG